MKKELGCGDVIYQIVRLFCVAAFVRNCAIWREEQCTDMFRGTKEEYKQ